MKIVSQTMSVQYKSPADFSEHYALVTAVGWKLEDMYLIKDDGVIQGFGALYKLYVGETDA